MSNAKTKRMKRIFKDAEPQKSSSGPSSPSAAHRRGQPARAQAAEAQLAAPTTGERLDLAPSSSAASWSRAASASAHRRALLDASMADLEAEYATWQAERQRANSLEKMVDRLTEEAAIEAAKARRGVDRRVVDVPPIHEPRRRS
ncbi:MAG: hypothetical protein R2710_12435 [Acidimicrobiales bacterium]